MCDETSINQGVRVIGELAIKVQEVIDSQGGFIEAEYLLEGREEECFCACKVIS